QTGGGGPPRPPRLSYDKGIRTLELTVVGHPGSPGALYAWYFLGCIYTDLGDASSSKHAFTRVLDWEGENRYYDEAVLRLANLELGKERYYEAGELYSLIAEKAEFYTDALYGLAYVNYVLAGVEDDPKRDEKVLGYFGELYSVSQSKLITEYCANLAAASLLSLSGYTDMPPPDDVVTIVEKYTKYFENPDAEAYLLERMGELRGDTPLNPQPK
ncbi:MAG: hypothetical protein GY771_16520, partial [bacterium]|nr:hypothetical protein [bacterium]